jgi:methylated-DNA-[protein]-cysteine S-methyltransferase
MTISMIRVTSPLATLRLFSNAGELVGVYLPDQDAPDAPTRRNDVLDAAAAQLAEYFAGSRRTFELPLGPRGTGFQQRVWRALEAIPYGETRSYGELARAIGRPAASRAVGTANARNPISIIVPCHRVIAASGALTGYAGGMAAKRWLLDHEQRVAGVQLRLAN